MEDPDEFDEQPEPNPLHEPPVEVVPDEEQVNDGEEEDAE